MTKTQAISDTGAVQRIYRAADLPPVTGFKLSFIYELMAEGKFPRPMKLGARAVGWLEADIAKWQRDRIAARDRKTKAEQK